ncbi:hypothetical protein [Pseudogemmobacter humi]|uniref:Uncharacterized protein n=1 Tax=Pseudogemmobacter humi TaxID=2483812 RepID=A0A3P5X7P1_9RHOB|nr:hypothetical protein [Pseudogemmobacter humi]VDC30672.1 hypothetical protein XINFAN_02632 [Pseudogemmobacter humi]
MPGHQAPFLPDPVPLREALRGLRHLLRRGGETLRDTITGTGMTEALPRPAASLAQSVLREAEGIARQMDEAASDLAKTVLGGADLSADARLSDLDTGPAFAAVIYLALARVLDRLGIRPAFISESAALRALSATSPGADDAGTAARLTRALLDSRVIRDIGPEAGAETGAIAVFAVMLWLQSGRGDGDDTDALAAAADLARALAPEIAAAGDEAALAQLYRSWAPHV